MCGGSLLWCGFQVEREQREVNQPQKRLLMLAVHLSAGLQSTAPLIPSQGGREGPGSSELPLLHHQPGMPPSLISNPSTLWSSDLPGTH